MRRGAVLLLAIAAVIVLARTQQAQAAKTYYVSPRGQDSAAGTSPRHPWRTVRRVDSAPLKPGDRVLFRGGAIFADATLSPRQSGSRSRPIVFGSYGTGRATLGAAGGAVWLPGNHHLVFEGLRLTTAGSATAIFAGAGSSAVTDITIRRCVLEDTRSSAVLAPMQSDARWTVQESSISHTGDSGLILRGSSHRILGNRISDTGFDTSIGYARHSIYSKGPDQWIGGNDISRDNGGQAVSIRYHGARVYDNLIHDTEYGIGFFDYDEARAPQGTSYVYGNRLWNISGFGFYYDGQRSPVGEMPSVNFVLASNTFEFSNASEAVNVSLSTSAHVVVANNIFTGSYGSALRMASTTIEHHNLWNGASSNIPHGVGDERRAPRLAPAPSLLPLPGSPALEAGTTKGAGIDYSGRCGAGPLAYCGHAPDMGAVEAAAR